MDPLASRSPGAGDMFLSVKGAKSGIITGEARDTTYKNAIEVVAWSWGMQGRAALGGGGATGKATVRELRVTKRVDKSSTALMAALRTNEPIKEATLTVRKAGKDPLEFFIVKIENGRVMSIDIEAGDKANSPAMFEKVTFSFNKITIQYTPQAEDGSAMATSKFEDQWDLNQ